MKPLLQCGLQPLFGLQRLWPFLLALMLIPMAVLGQTNGYIYVHNKTLDESSAIDFSYSVSGGPTSVPGFTLNDRPDNIRLGDLGVSRNGRLWTVSTTNVLYYRDLGSANWTQSSVTNALRVDGGPTNTSLVVSTSGTLSLFDGTTSFPVPALPGSRIITDVGDASVSTYIVYAVANDGTLWLFNGSSWAQVGTSTNNANRVDGDPSTGDAIIGKTDGNAYRITAAGIETGLSKPVGVGANMIDIAVDDAGTIYGVFTISSTAYVFKFLGGTSWSSEEVTSRRVGMITAGPGGQVWLRHEGSGGNFSAPIFSRAVDGSGNVWWVDDERVRTSPVAGNSQFFAVEPGTYTITQTVPGGWDLQKLEVFDPSGNSSTNLVGNSVTLTVAAGETVHAIFTNGIVNPFAMTNSCVNIYTEDFGTGAVDTYGPVLTGQTSYHYQDISGTGQDGYYKVIGKSELMGIGAGGTAGLRDHTSGDGLGRMMVVNAAYDKNEFFRRRFTGLVPGASYNFTAWLANINNLPIKPNVTFSVIDVSNYAVLGQVTTGDITSYHSWQQYGLNFVATVAQVDLVITNNSIGGNGNDLALDDISFSMAPPNTPITTVTNAACGSPTGGITVTSPLGASYQYSLDNATWQSSPDFTAVAAGTYTVYARFLTTMDCISSKVDTVRMAVCGNVLADANGSTDNIVNGTGTNGGTTLYAVLYDNTTGAVIDTALVAPDGSYSLGALAGNNASIYISTTPAIIGQTAIPSVSLPDGWVNTGENNCVVTVGCTGTDGTPDGVLSLGAVTTPITEANFGLDQVPTAIPVDESVPQPSVGTIITLDGNGGNPVSPSGTDPEDGTISTGGTIVITALPDNTVLLYNNVPVTAGQVIAGFDPSQLQVQFTAETIGDTSTTFQYAVVDQAGVQSPTVDYTVNWEAPMPVKLVSISALAIERTVELNWVTALETNSGHFQVEHAGDAVSWKTIGTVKAQGEGSQLSAYRFVHPSPAGGANYYRLKMVDLDGTYAFSRIVSVKMGENIAGLKVAVFPNPASTQLFLSGVPDGAPYELLDLSGRKVLAGRYRSTGIGIEHLSQGLYLLKLAGQPQGKLTLKVLVGRK